MSSERNSRSFSNELLETLEPCRPREHLRASLTRLLTEYPPKTAAKDRPQGLFSGPTSVAYLFLRLSQLYPENGVEDATEIGEDFCGSHAGLSWREWSQEYLRAARKARETGRRKEFEPRAGGVQDEVLAHACLKAALTQDRKYVFRALDWASFRVTDGVDPDTNEWLYGRAGTLYLLRLLPHFCPTVFAASESQALTDNPSKALEHLINSLIEHIFSRDVPWKWHGKEYLGAVHGDAGVLAQILLSTAYLPRDSQARFRARAETRLARYLAEQLPDGNWPSSRLRTGASGSSHSFPQKQLTQFCHGAPGAVVALTAVRALVSENLRPQIDTAVHRARAHVWEGAGLLVKESCLCHGIAGNALAFDAGDPRFEMFLRAATPERLARGLRDRSFTPSSDAYGLLWGEAGRAWVWAVLDAHQTNLRSATPASFITFSDV